MKKNLLKNFVFIILTTVLISLTTTSDAQIRYTDFETIEDVKIEYRWQRSNIFKSETRTILNLRIENTNDYPVNIEFVVGFYESGKLEYKSEDMEKCFEAGERKRGGLADLRFQCTELTRNAIESEDFDWEFIHFNVEQTDECP